MSNLKSGNGIVALGGTLDYNQNALTFVSMSGEGAWSSPMYNSANGKFTALRSDLGKSDEVVFKIKFKVKDNAERECKF